MAEQLLGVLSVAVLFLAYVLILQCLTAAALLLARYIALQVQSLRSLLGESPRTVPAPLIDQDSGESYRLGGGLARW
jgi:hypothetical protein